MQDNRLGDLQSKKSSVSEDNRTIQQLKEQISNLKTELVQTRGKLKVWNDIAEEGLLIHERFIIREVNQALLKMTGYSKKELIGQDSSMLVTKESYEKLKKQLATGYAELMELDMVSKRGEIFQVFSKGKTINVGDKEQRAVLLQNITEYKKTQKELKTSEEKHRLISSLLSDYVYICRIKPEGSPEIEWVSGAIENISGYTPEEIDKLEHGWFSIVHPEDLQKIVGTMDYNYSESKFYSNEYRLIDKSGNIRWVQDKSMCTKIDQKTQELTLLGATKEITERKKIEEDLLNKNREFEKVNLDLSKSNQELSAVNLRLKESEDKYKNLIHSATIGVGISDGEKILFANQSLLDLFGIDSFEEFASKKLTDYVPENAKELVREKLLEDQKFDSKDEIFRHEIVRSDGKLRTVQVVINDIIFEGKKCKQFLITDITSQQELDNALQQASNIFKNIQIGLFIYRLDDMEDDRSLRMVAVNPASSQIVGIPESEMVGKKIDVLFPELRKNKIPQQFAEVVRTQIPVSFDDIYYEDGNIGPSSYSVKVFPLPDQCAGISFENVSDRRKAERDLMIRNHELNNFVYKVSHDLRAPLSSIKGLINLSRLEENSIDHLPRIEDRIDHLDAFIRDILSHSRNLNTAVVVEKIELEQLVRDWFKDLEYMNINSSIATSISITGTDFYSDKARLSEIIRNLVSNALKYHDGKKEHNYINVTGKVSKKKARLVFEDNGIGIREQYLDDIFKMFYRATEEAEGSGIGLYIVQQSLENIGGKVSVKSKFKIGSSFTIEIPNLISQKREVY